MIAGIIGFLTYADVALCALALFMVLRSGDRRSHQSLSALLICRIVSSVILLTCIQVLDLRHLDVHSTGYWVYYSVYWAEAAVEAFLSLYVISHVFQLAMKPLKGLQRLGAVVFRWATFVCVGLAFLLGFRPTANVVDLVASVMAQFTAITSILTLGLLLFVCFAIHPLGLSFRSRPFGISLGLGVSAAFNLVQNAWAPQLELYTWANLLVCVSGSACLIIWAAYFYLPEVKPRILMLPTTSPYLVWNEISEALGDEPGYVAVAGIAPDVFSPAEMEIMFRASAMMDALGPGTAEKPATSQALSA